MLRVAAILLIGCCLGAGGSWLYRTAFDDESDVASDEPASSADKRTKSSSTNSPARRSVVALGTIEPREGVVQIGSPLVGYQVKSVQVRDGQLVRAGDTLVELDASAVAAELELTRSQLAEAAQRQQAELTLNEQRVATAKLAVRQATEGRPLELDAQKSRVSLALARKKQAEKDFERLESLRKLAEPLATEQQVEHQRVLVEAGVAELEAAEVALKRLEQSLTFQAQTAEAELQAAEQAFAVTRQGTGLESLKRRVEMAQLKLEQTKIVAPAAGVVMAVSVHAGEIVAQQPLLQLADLDNLVCAAEVDAADVPALRPNHKAVVSCRAFRDATLDGVVDRVGNQVVQSSLRPTDPRKPVDRDMTKVIVSIDSKKAAELINASGTDHRVALVGLQVEVSFPLAEQVP